MKEKKDFAMSRRSFFKGSAFALGGVAAAGLIKPQTASAQAVDMTGCPVKPWEKPLSPIPASEIKKTVNTDVVIIGAGLAGLCAAISAK